VIVDLLRYDNFVCSPLPIGPGLLFPSTKYEHHKRALFPVFGAKPLPSRAGTNDMDKLGNGR